MDIAENLDLSFEEQCFIQIDGLRQDLLRERRSPRPKHRIYRNNLFDNINDQKRQSLDRLLCYTLKLLGNQINSNLKAAARENRSMLSTPTPIRELSVDTLTNRRQSVELPASPAERTRSYSRCSDIIEPVSEFVAISSDEEVDDDEEIRIKIEPGTSSDIPLNQLTFMAATDLSSPSCRDLGNRNETESPNSLLIIDRKRLSNYEYDSNGVIRLKSKNDIRYSSVGPSRQALILHVIANALRLIESQTYMTKRELYYLSLDFCRVAVRRVKQSQGTQSSTQMDSQLSSSQARYKTKKLEFALDDLCCLVGCSKAHLHILTQPKGLVFGDIRFKLKSGELYDCLSKREGLTLPTAQDPIAEMESSAKFVLILEKDSVFQRILNQEEETNFIKIYKVILFTAKGYPDVTSRAFLNFLWSKLKIPILALTDADPHGFEIVCAYKFGSYSTAYETSIAIPQVRWLGLLPSDLLMLKIPDSEITRLTKSDTRKLDSLFRRPYLRNRANWLRQLEVMRASGEKVELDSLSDLVRIYLPNKLRFASWL